MLYASSLSKRIVDISEQCTVIQCLLSIHSFHPSNSISDRITKGYVLFQVICFRSVVPNLWHQELVLWRTIFPQTGIGGGCFWDDSSVLHLLCTLLLHQLHLRSSGIRSWRLGTPVLDN